MRLLARVGLIKREYQFAPVYCRDGLMLQQTFRNRPPDLIVNIMYKVYADIVFIF